MYIYIFEIPLNERLNGDWRVMREREKEREREREKEKRAFLKENLLSIQTYIDCPQFDMI